MEANYTTERLVLNKLSLNDMAFIKDLVNTKEWLKFIGDRNVKTNEDSKKYVQKIIENPNVDYWVVTLKSKNISIGIITFIKRDYLDYPDIGFAFLPEYAKNGYAYEASETILKDAIHTKRQKILAITVKENINSTKLLKKLGFDFNKEIKVEKELLIVYSLKNKQFFIKK
jgi:RimJ/RimL family protein N-acetyltransferase